MSEEDEKNIGVDLTNENSEEPNDNQDIVSLVNTESDSKVDSRIKFEEFTDERAFIHVVFDLVSVDNFFIL